MKRLKILIAYLNIIRLFPHAIVFLLKRSNLKDDVLVNTSECLGGGSLMTRFLYLMVFQKYYRNLFYYRIGKLKYLIGFLCPKANNFILSPTTTIGSGLRLEHPYGTNINAESIGNNCYFFQLSSVGVNAGQRPIVGNDVVFYANSSAYGNITIGNHAVISSGAVVRKSVPPYAIVVGNPAKIVGFCMNPEDAYEAEKSYPESERASLQTLEKNYKKYFLDRMEMIKEFNKV